MLPRKTSEELKKLVAVDAITSVIRSGRLKLYGDVMRKRDEDWMKKCMEHIVEGKRPVGKPRRTLLESVEADIADLEIDREGVHDRKK